MTINAYGYNEDYWGNLAQFQTLAVRASVSRYAGYEQIAWHPYQELPKLSLNERFKSFAARLSKAVGA